MNQKLHIEHIYKTSLKEFGEYGFIEDGETRLIVTKIFLKIKILAQLLPRLLDCLSDYQDQGGSFFQPYLEFAKKT